MIFKNKTVIYKSSARLLVALSLLFGLSFFVSAWNPQVAHAVKPDGARVTESEACGDYKGQQKDACSEGYSATAGAKAVVSPTKDYDSEEAADAKDACSRFKNADNNKACQKGYKEGHYALYHRSPTDPARKDAGKGNNKSVFGNSNSKYQCGKGENAVKTNFNFGCLGENAPNDMGAVLDLAYAIIRFLSAGVGIAIVASIIVAGIQYSTTEGKPDAAAASKDRIRNAVIGLVIYMFAFSLIQYLVPGGLFT